MSSIILVISILSSDERTGIMVHGVSRNLLVYYPTNLSLKYAFH